MDVIKNYINAKREFQAVDQELAHIGMFFRDLGLKILRDPETVVFTGTDVGLPGGLEYGKPERAEDWPSSIQTLVARRYDARRKMETAWAAIPEEDRKELQPPHNR